MGLFSDILLCADYDRTLTAPDSTIPARNLEAIRYFMDNGGAFTVNTGRSLPMARLFMDRVPVNAPLLLYNGGAAYDTASRTFPILHPIDMDQAEAVRQIGRICTGLILEIQAIRAHITFGENEPWARFYDAIGCSHDYAAPGDDLGPFLKLSICGPFHGSTIDSFFTTTPEITAMYDRVEDALRQAFGPQLSVMRAAPQIIDIQAGGVSKGLAARELAAQMGRKTLVCVGDERNDIAMLDMADYAYCPCDGNMAHRYENVCACGEGAVADVIYKKIPEILGIQP